MQKQTTGALVIAKTKSGAPVYEAKWRPGGKQKKLRIGPAWLEPDGEGGWTKRKGRAPDGHFDERRAAVAMRDLIANYEIELAEAKRRAESEAAGVVTFADAAEAWYRRAVRRQRKPSTLRDYRQVLDAYLLPERPIPADGSEAAQRRGAVARLDIPRAPFSTLPVAELSGNEAAYELREWFAELPYSRTKEKLLTIVRSILGYAMAEGWTDENVAKRVDRDSIRYDGTYDWYIVAEVESLTGVAGSVQDATLYATAAMTGLRQGELIALRWRDIDVAAAKLVVRGNVSFGQLVTPKSGKVRTVPLVPKVAQQLLALREREHFTGNNDQVFPGTAGGFMDRSAMRRRYVATVKRANLRHLPFHSLRHHFGSQAVQLATLPQVRDWMGHSDIRTTARYLHAKDRIGDAELLARAFEITDAQRQLDGLASAR